jgi:hypothetical protein
LTFFSVALAIGNKSMDKNIVFDLAGNKIKCEKEVKLLGVTIDFELKFNFNKFSYVLLYHYK